MELPEPWQEATFETSSGRDSYVAGRDVTVYNYASPDDHETLASAIQGDNERADLSMLLGLDRFIGRRQLITQITEFIATRNHGWVLVEGQAGVGKSALATYLAETNGWFFHSTSIAGGTTPETVRKNLAAQLIRAFGLEAGHAPPAQVASADYLASVLKFAAAKAGAAETGRRPIVLVIDSLNEIDSAGQSVNPVGLPATKALPYKVFVIATRRRISDPWSPGSPTLLADIESGEAHELDDDDETGQDEGHRTRSLQSGPNAQDMREYLRRLLEGADQDQDLAQKLRNYDIDPAEFTETLVSKCAGVWIYLKLVLKRVRDGRGSPADVIFSLPSELREYYLDEIRQQREPDSAKWQRLHCPALATLAALRQPVTFEELADLAGIRESDSDNLWDWLDNVQPHLHVRENPASHEFTYEIRHQSLREWVANPGRRDHLGRELPEALRQAHVRITRHLTPPGLPGQRDWANAGKYVHGMLAEHAAAAERLGAPGADPGLLDELVSDPGFLLSCQPSSVLLRRRYLKTPEGKRAVSAYEAALSEWAGLPSDEGGRAWRLHVWARKTAADNLALASGKVAGRVPVIEAAMWTGTTHRTIHAHHGSVGTLTLLPARDGSPLLASGGSDGYIRFWDLDSEAPQQSGPETPGEEPRSSHDDWVTAAAAVPLPDQHVLLATGDRKGTVRLWDPRTGEPVGGPLTSRGAPVSAIVALRRADDRAMLAVGGGNGSVRFWDPAERAAERTLVIARRGEITAMAAVPTREGQLLATGSSDGRVRLWDPWTGEPVGDPLTVSQGPVSAIAAVPVADDRTVLAAGGKDGMTIHPWDPRTRRPIEAPRTGHTSPVNAITVARLARQILLITAGQDRKIRLWDVGTGAVVTFPVHTRWVNAVMAVPLPDGRLLIATAGSDGKIELQELYESADGTLAAAVPSTGHLGAVNAMAVAQFTDRTVLVSGSRDRTVRLWEPETGKPARQDPLAGHTGPLSAVATVPLPGGRALIATSGGDGTVRLWDDPLAITPTARLLKRCGQIYAIASVTLPDRTLLATGGSDGMVRLWEPDTGESTGLPLAGHVGPVNVLTSMRLGDERILLVSGGSDGSVRFWDPATGMAVLDPLIGYGGRIRAVAAMRLPGGDILVATGGDYGVVEVWHGTDRTAVIEPAGGQAAAVNAIAAVELPGRTLLATGDDGGAVRLWDPVTGAPAAGPLTSLLTGHDGPVRTIASMRLPGGRTLLATGGNDKTILIWAFES
jgi:WD40 repeat protein